MRGLAVAHEPRHVGDGNRGLLAEQLRGDAHAPLEQILAEAAVSELGIGSLELSRRARERSRHRLQGQLAAIVARDDHTRQQVQPVTSRGGVVAHAL